MAKFFDEITLSRIARTCFRGDSREPEEIFKKGFKPRSIISNELYTLIHDQLAQKNNRADIYAKLMILIRQRHAEKGDRWATPDLIKAFNETPDIYIDSWFDRIELGVARKTILVEDDEKSVREVIQDFFESNHLIATSSRFKAATLFPISIHDKLENMKTAWIYVLHVAQGFDVHKQAVLALIMNQLNPATKKTPTLLEIAMHLYVDEIITNEIPCEKIICAVKIKKNQQIDENGYITGSFTLVDNIIINPSCTLSKAMQRQAIDFINQEIKLNQQACKFNRSHPDKTLPTPASGFTRIVY